MTSFQIYIGNQGIAANANIKQIVEVITEPEKQNKFLNFFREAHQKGQKVRVTIPNLVLRRFILDFGIHRYKKRMRQFSI